MCVTPLHKEHRYLVQWVFSGAEFEEELQADEAAAAFGREIWFEKSYHEMESLELETLRIQFLSLFFYLT